MSCRAVRKHASDTTTRLGNSAERFQGGKSSTALPPHDSARLRQDPQEHRYLVFYLWGCRHGCESPDFSPSSRYARLRGLGLAEKSNVPKPWESISGTNDQATWC